MMFEDQYVNEIRQRELADREFVVEVIATSDDETLKDIFVAELEEKLSKWKDYRFGIVMPAAQRNLAVVLLQERVDLKLAKKIFTFLARALAHLHGNGIIHGDFKVRF